MNIEDELSEDVRFLLAERDKLDQLITNLWTFGKFGPLVAYAFEINPVLIESLARFKALHPAPSLEKTQ